MQIKKQIRLRNKSINTIYLPCKEKNRSKKAIQDKIRKKKKKSF